MKPKVYLETTIPSYLTSRPSRDVVIAAHQQITREWWDTRSQAFDLYVSQLVIDEAGGGDPGAAFERLKIIQRLPLLDLTSEVEVLSLGILRSGCVPRKAATDAAHIAVAAVHAMDLLITWNCVHIANAVIVRALARACRSHGYECPVICTPEELLGELG